RTGAIRLVESDPTMPIADRAIKVADRLAEFLLGAWGGLAGIGDPAAARRFDVPERVYGRTESIEEIARSLGAETRLPLVVCGPSVTAWRCSSSGRRRRCPNAARRGRR